MVLEVWYHSSDFPPQMHSRNLTITGELHQVCLRREIQITDLHGLEPLTQNVPQLQTKLFSPEMKIKSLQSCSGVRQSGGATPDEPGKYSRRVSACEADTLSRRVRTCELASPEAFCVRFLINECLFIGDREPMGSLWVWFTQQSKTRPAVLTLSSDWSVQTCLI